MDLRRRRRLRSLSVEGRTPPRGNRRPAGRLLAALAIALPALAAAVVGAVGPGRSQQGVYDWPPPVLPAAVPQQAWYTPLVLMRQKAGAVDATIPCDLPAPLVPDSDAVTIFATARNPESARGLQIRRDHRELSFMLGNDEFARTRIPRSGATPCRFTLAISGVEWRLDTPDQNLRGELQDAPFVSSLFSGLDLGGSGERPTIRITSEQYGVAPSLLQRIAWLVAALAALAALALVCVRRRPARLFRPRFALPRLVDAVVVGVLVVWMFLGPAFFDDGWVKARQENFLAAGRFSNYYDTYATAVPLGYWLEWLQHWVVGFASSALVMRLPTLVVLVATWACCRAALRLVLPTEGDPARIARWLCAVAYLTGALAWTMTLRPEFVVCFLAAVALLAALRFLERPSFVPLALGVVLLALAVTAHPAGLTVAAPYLAIAPDILRWLRRAGRGVWLAAATLGTVGAALVLLLVFVGTDLAQWLADYEVFRKSQTHDLTWRDELQRYVQVAEAGSVLRKASIVVFILAVAAFALRGTRRRTPLLDLPARTLLLGFVLLIPTPSKWPWHFGVLVAFGAVAVGAEAVRWIANESKSTRTASALGAFAVAAAAFGWAWAPRPPWGVLDVRTATWTWPVESVLSFGAAAWALAGLAALLLAHRARRRRGPGGESGFATALVTATIPLFLVPIIIFTFATFARDAIITDGWTFSKQNLADVAGRGGCGVADDLHVLRTGSVVPLVSLEEDVRPTTDLGLLPDPPLADLAVIGGQDQLRTTSTVSPWYAVPASGPIGYFEHGFGSSTGNVRLEWGERHGAEVAVVESERVDSPTSVFDPFALPWRFRTERSLPEKPADADAVRLIVEHHGGDPISQVAASAPVAYATDPLTSWLSGRGLVALVDPQVRLYFPCVRQPELAHGIAEPSDFVVAWVPGTIALTASSGTYGLTELYSLEDLSTKSGSGSPFAGFGVYRVNRRIEGAVVAPLTRVSG
jgi:hypothetical protein